MKRLFVIPVAVAALLVGSAHAANYWSLEYLGVSGANVTIQHSSWTGSRGATAGLFNMVSLNELSKPGFDTFAVGKEFFTFCTDIGVNIKTIWNYDPVSFDDADPGVAPPWRVGGIQDAAWLFNEVALPQQTFTTTQAAAMQLAIWKVLYDEVDRTALDLNANFYGLTDTDASFWVVIADNAVLTQAAAYLEKLYDETSPMDYATTWLRPENGQSQGLIYPPTGLLVPDGGLTILLLGLSCLGLGLARRKHSS